MVGSRRLRISALIPTVAFLQLAGPHSSTAQDAQVLTWSMAALHVTAFDGTGVGVASAVALRLPATVLGFSSTVAVSGWHARPALEGPRTSGTPGARALSGMGVELALRSPELFRRTRAVVAFPVQVLWSAVGESPITEAVFPGPPPYNQAGVQTGLGLGASGGFQFSVVGSFSAEIGSQVLYQRLYRQRAAIWVHRIGVSIGSW